MRFVPHTGISDVRTTQLSRFNPAGELRLLGHNVENWPVSGLDYQFCSCACMAYADRISGNS